MNDRPSAVELLTAVRAYLEEELLPALTDPRQRFQTLVAANVLAVAERELQTEETSLAEEWRLLRQREDDVPAPLSALRAAVRAENQRLCEAIRRGEFDDPERFRAASALARSLVEKKLEAANPRYLASFRR